MLHAGPHIALLLRRAQQLFQPDLGKPLHRLELLDKVRIADLLKRPADHPRQQHAQERTPGHLFDNRCGRALRFVAQQLSIQRFEIDAVAVKRVDAVLQERAAGRAPAEVWAEHQHRRPLPRTDQLPGFGQLFDLDDDSGCLAQVVLHFQRPLLLGKAGRGVKLASIEIDDGDPQRIVAQCDAEHQDEEHRHGQ